jgi:cupin 2 domain-containing protein
MAANLFANIPAELPDELFETLASSGAVRVERIISRGHASPEGFWYCQEQAEFVLLLKGETQLTFAEPLHSQRLVPGDWLVIEAGCRHRVDWTASKGDTLWLAVFF